MRGAPLGRALAIALLLGGALGFPVTPAAAAVSPCPTSDPCLAIHLPNGHIDYLTASQLRIEAAAAQGTSSGVADGTNYPQLTPSGAPTDVVTVASALSVNALISPLLAGMNPPVPLSAVTFTYMPRGDGTWSILTADELSGAPTVFQDSSLLPAYYSPLGQDQIRYVRPLLNNADSNLVDDGVGTEPPANVLDLFVQTGPLLTVKASASVSASTTVKIGQPITFTATSSGDSISPRFTWTNLNSGKDISHLASFTYKFAAAGVYGIQVTAAGSDDSAGTAAPLFITVGSAHFKGSPHPGGSKSPSPHPTRTPTEPPSPSPSATSTNGAGGSASATPGPSSTSGSTTGQGQGPTTPAAPTVSPDARPSDASNGAPVVEGRLIGQTVALLTPSQSVATQTSVGVTPATRLSGIWRVTAGVGSAVAIILLFAAGAFRELRWSRRRGSVRPQ
jgi:PKD domain